jgi:uncharacterized protein (UPF0248 family)
MGIQFNVRDILNDIKWTKDIEKVEIWILHRGAQNNMKKISGKEIKTIKKSFIETTTTTIPYHRILKIIYDEEIIFNRQSVV